VAKIYNDYKDHADFLTIYVREAHPTDEWQMKSNVKDDVCYAQPKNLEQRIAIANDFVKRFSYPVPFGIDDMSNAANDAYSAWPERLYIVDESGHIAYRGGMGPFNYNPAEARAWLAARYGEVAPQKPEAGPSSPSPSSPSQAPAAPGATPAPASPAPAPANTAPASGKS
jgi:Iodothyronine deiodinase